MINSLLPLREKCWKGQNIKTRDVTHGSFHFLKQLFHGISKHTLKHLSTAIQVHTYTKNMYTNRKPIPNLNITHTKMKSKMNTPQVTHIDRTSIVVDTFPRPFQDTEVVRVACKKSTPITHIVLSILPHISVCVQREYYNIQVHACVVICDIFCQRSHWKKGQFLPQYTDTSVLTCR